jgi:hypothetical protein
MLRFYDITFNVACFTGLNGSLDSVRAAASASIGP